MRFPNVLGSRTFYGLLLGLVSLAPFQLAHAGYAQPTPPSGFSGSPSQWTFRSANSADWLTNGTVRTNAALNVGGRSVIIPATLRVAANAGTFAARYAFANPLLLTASAIAIVAAQNISWDQVTGRWIHTSPANPEGVPISNGQRYRLTVNDPWMPTFATACEYAATTYFSQPWRISTSGTCQRWAGTMDGWRNLSLLTSPSPLCPSGWFVTPSGCFQTLPPSRVPQDEQQFIERVAPQIQPAQVPQILPATVPVPVELPVINPDPANPTVPRPLTIPLGDPQAIPNTNPQQWRQPVVQIVPSPTASNPWRVDVQPKDIISTSPQSIPEVSPDPLPEGSSTQPSQESDFCIKNPDVLACQKLVFDTPEQEIPKREVTITYIPENLGGGGSCVPPVNLNYFGGSVLILDTNQACGWISSYLRPVVIFIGAFIALGILVGGVKI